MKQQAFHLALPCEDIEVTKKFYQTVLGANIGRSSEQWIDIDLYKNQITFTECGRYNFLYKNYRLGKHVLPSFHFGIILDAESWDELYNTLVQSKLNLVKDFTTFKEKIGEHRSFFVKDPNGFMVEFKNFKRKEEIFAM
jgi:extradiol dioxygenase family protein